MRPLSAVPALVPWKPKAEAFETEHLEHRPAGQSRVPVQYQTGPAAPPESLPEGPLSEQTAAQVLAWSRPELVPEDCPP